MKKLLLITTAAMLAFPAFSQDTVGEGTLDNPYGEKSPWVLTVNRTQPEAEDTYYYIPKTENSKGNDDIYTLEVTLPNVAHGWQQSCYYLTATYTAEDGTQTKVVFTTGQSANNGSRYDLPFGGPDVSLIVSTWGTNNAVWNIKEYTLCDSKWTAFGYFSGNIVGNKSQRIYFYNPTEKSLYQRYFGGNAGGDDVVGTLYVTGANPLGTFAVNQSNIANPGINTATIDYTTGVIEIEAVNELPVYIDGLTPFVAPATLDLPTNIEAFELEKYEEGSIYLKKIESAQIEAFQPVILTATEPGEYLFTISSDVVFDHVDLLYYKDKDTKYLKDAEVSVGEFSFCGVNQFHNLPANSYILTEDEFVLNTSAKNIVNPFTGYLKYNGSEDAPESISIVFPEEEEQDGITVNLGSDTTNQSGTIENNEITITTVGDGALIYVEVGDEVRSIYYYIAEKEVVEEDGPEDLPSGSYAGKRRVLPDGASYTEAKVNNGVVTIPLEVGEGQLHIATSADGDNEQVFTYTVAKGVPTAVEAIETAPDEDGAIYNIFGQKVDASYKGIVIKNGKKFIQR